MLNMHLCKGEKAMDIVKGQEQDIPDIMHMFSKCVEHMESQGIDQWNEYYPNRNIIENDIEDEHCYVLKDNGKCIAYVAIDEEQPPEYRQVNWIFNGRKVLVIHRLAVHPECQFY